EVGRVEGQAAPHPSIWLRVPSMAFLSTPPPIDSTAGPIDGIRHKSRGTKRWLLCHMHINSCNPSFQTTLRSLAGIETAGRVHAAPPPSIWQRVPSMASVSAHGQDPSPSANVLRKALHDAERALKEAKRDANTAHDKIKTVAARVKEMEKRRAALETKFEKAKPDATTARQE